MDSPELFQRDLHDGLLDVPYCPAEGRDLYRVYRTYCDRNGILRPVAMEMFSQKFRSMNGVTRQRAVRVPEKIGDWASPATAWPQRVVFYMGVKPAELDDKAWLLDGIKRFRDAAKDYCRGAWAGSGNAGRAEGPPPSERESRREGLDDPAF